MSSGNSSGGLGILDVVLIVNIILKFAQYTNVGDIPTQKIPYQWDFF